MVEPRLNEDTGYRRPAQLTDGLCNAEGFRKSAHPCGGGGPWSLDTSGLGVVTSTLLPAKAVIGSLVTSKMDL
jgi:hypothetical protein